MAKDEIKDAILKMHFEPGDILFVDARLPIDTFAYVKLLPFSVPVVPIYRLGFRYEEVGEAQWEPVEAYVYKMSREEAKALLEMHGA